MMVQATGYCENCNKLVPKDRQNQFFCSDECQNNKTIRNKCPNSKSNGCKWPSCGCNPSWY